MERTNVKGSLYNLLCIFVRSNVTKLDVVGLASLTSSYFAYWTPLILGCQVLNAGSNIVSAISLGVIHPRVIHVLARLLLQSFLTRTLLMCLAPSTGSPNCAIMSLMNFLNSVVSVDTIDTVEGVCNGFLPYTRF